jgi:hypothetical protein
MRKTAIQHVQMLFKYVSKIPSLTQEQLMLAPPKQVPIMAV